MNQVITQREPRPCRSLLAMLGIFAAAIFAAMLFANEATAGDRMFWTAEDKGQPNAGDAVFSLDLETGEHRIEPWGSMTYAPWELELHQVDGERVVYASSKLGWNTANRAQLYDPTTGESLGGANGGLRLPVGVRHVKGEWTAALGYNGTLKEMQVAAWAGDDWGLRSPRAVDIRIDAPEGRFRPAPSIAMDLDERKVLALNLESDRWGAPFLLVDCRTGEYEFIPHEFPVPYRYLTGLTYDGTRGFAAVTDLNGGLFLFRTNGTIDPREWERTAHIEPEAPGLVPCVLSAFGCVYWLEGADLCMARIRDGLAVDTDRLTMRAAAPLEAKFESRLGYYAGSIVAMVGPEDEGPFRAMCAVSMHFATRSTEVLVDLRPGSPLNPDGIEWWIRDCIIVPEGA